jgi:hypothetical protein
MADAEERPAAESAERKWRSVMARVISGENEMKPPPRAAARSVAKVRRLA